MRTFSSYGPVNTELNFYVPRKALVDRITQQLLGDAPDIGGHYITVWAPRQSGKTWLMQQVAAQIESFNDFEIVMISMKMTRHAKDEQSVCQLFVQELSHHLQRELPPVTTWSELTSLFNAAKFSKPLILIIDDFNAVDDDSANRFADIFRSLYLQQSNSTKEKSYGLHGLAMVGLKSLTGTIQGTVIPFNVQRSMHIPNLTMDEVRDLFDSYKRERGQTIEPDVIPRIYAELEGQPGLTCWFGELLTDTFNDELNKPLTAGHFEKIVAWATTEKDNPKIQDIIHIADCEPYRNLVLELFITSGKARYHVDDFSMNFLYHHDVVGIVETSSEFRIRFSSPFIQRRLFNHFSAEIFPCMGQLYPPFEDLSNAITDTSLNVPNLLKVYERYLQQNREWLLQEVPRKSNMRPYEAVFHFNLYMYLSLFFQRRNGMVFPEFPTGNGQIDLVIDYAGQRFGIELKSFTDVYEYREGLKQAARYGKRLGLSEITLVLFIEAIDDANREKYEAVHFDDATNTTVLPVFVVTGT